jgi:hypothetical protein
LRARLPVLTCFCKREHPFYGGPELRCRARHILALFGLAMNDAELLLNFQRVIEVCSDSLKLWLSMP